MLVIFDNLIYSLQRAGGISTYWMELSKRILHFSDFNVKFVEHNSSNNISHLRIRDDFKNIFRVGRFGSFFIRFFKDKHIYSSSKFIYHSSYYTYSDNKNALNILTVHDFVHERFYSGVRRLIHSIIKNRAIRHSSQIIVVSQSTKKDLLNFFPNIDPQKVTVVYNGVSDDFYLINNINEHEDYYLFVGSREKYKNFDFVVECLKHDDSNRKLYIVGNKLRNSEIEFLNESLGNNRWLHFCNISNAELNYLYNSAFALFYPSSYEGFGIPLLEAMKSGCPFIALNISSIPEVAGEAGHLLKSLHVEDFLIAKNQIECNRESIVNKGLAQVSKFSWDKCYKETMNIYDILIKNEGLNYNSHL
jgi:glycosyltransferase involved in cell wall biosynthesis